MRPMRTPNQTQVQTRSEIRNQIKQRTQTSAFRNTEQCTDAALQVIPASTPNALFMCGILATPGLASHVLLILERPQA